jgi:hypothetical protein
MLIFKKKKKDHHLNNLNLFIKTCLHRVIYVQKVTEICLITFLKIKIKMTEICNYWS